MQKNMAGCEYNMKTAVVIPGGDVQKALISLLQHKGYRTFVLDGDSCAPCFKMSEGFVVDITDLSACENILKQLDDVGIIISNCSDVGQYLATYLSKQFGLPGAPHSKLTRDKELMKKAFCQHNIRTATYQVIREKQSLCDVDWSSAKVIKPAIGAGSNGVEYVRSPEELSNYMFDFGNKKYLLENFIPGSELAIDGFVINGTVHTLTISHKERSELPYLLDKKLYIERYVAEKYAALNALACEVCLATQMNNCAFHIEVIRGSDAFYVVECASRGPGFDVFNKIIPKVTGIDTLRTLLSLAEGGRELVHKKGQISNFALLSFPEFGSGKVIEICNEYDNNDSCEFHLLFDEGDVIHPVTSGSLRHSYGIAFNETKRGCDTQIDNVLQKVQVKVD